MINRTILTAFPLLLLVWVTVIQGLHWPEEAVYVYFKLNKYFEENDNIPKEQCRPNHATVDDNKAHTFLTFFFTELEIYRASKYRTVFYSEKSNMLK